MKYITSTQNPDIKKIVSLHDKKGRTRHNLFMVEGLKNILTFIDTGWQPVEVYVLENKLKDVKELQVLITVVSPVVLHKMSTAATPSGIIALFPLKKQNVIPQAGSLVLAGLQDPGNMGTLIRTAAALSCPNILIIDGADPFSPKVIQAAAGAHALVPVVEIEWQELVKKKKNVSLCALVVEGGKAPEELDLINSILVVGSEAHGIPQEWIDECDQLLTLPMPGKTESLNAAVAGSIAVYERHKGLKK